MTMLLAGSSTPGVGTSMVVEVVTEGCDVEWREFWTGSNQVIESSDGRQVRINVDKKSFDKTKRQRRSGARGFHTEQHG
jgi:hypothetical protein